MHTYVCISANIAKHPSALFKKFYFSDVGAALRELKRIFPHQEHLILQKCNCVELHSLGKKPQISTLLRFWKNQTGQTDFSQVDIFREKEAILHLFETAIGMKSITVGDSQVYGQVKNAFKEATKNQTKGEQLHKIEERLKGLIKEIDKTSFRRGNTSIPRIVTEMINKKYQHKKILIIGAGQTGTLLAKLLSEKKYEIGITNRTETKAQLLAKKYHCHYEPFSQAIKACSRYDIIILAINKPSYINNNNSSQIDNKPIFIDISNPPAVTARGFTVHDLQEFSQQSKETNDKRLKAAQTTINIIKKHANKAFTSMEDQIIKKIFTYISTASEKDVTRLYTKFKEDLSIESNNTSGKRHALFKHIRAISTDKQRIQCLSVEIALICLNRACLLPDVLLLSIERSSLNLV